MPFFHSKSPADTRKLGKNFAKSLLGGEVLALYGGLGAGKTEFIKGLAVGLGIKKLINSPTFVILKSYRAPVGKKIRSLLHFDLYRVNDFFGADASEWIESMNCSDCITAIEWPEKFGPRLPRRAFKITLAYGKKKNQRTIQITKPKWRVR